MSNDHKDMKVVHDDNASFDEDPKHVAGLEAADGPVEVPDRARKEKRLVRKLDARMSVLVIVYILNYDRNNLSAARTKGLEADLNLVDRQTQVCLSILYVGYILLQAPSNWAVVRFGRPSIYLPTCMIIWGVISILSGITQGYVGLLMTRFTLGIVEAAFFPGAVYLLSAWFTKKELSLRICLLYIGSLLSNAFGPLIAAGILADMEGVLNQRAWRWLFYIEGALTVFIAFLCIFILPDFPHNTKRGFTDDERLLAQIRMKEDTGETGKEDISFGTGFMLCLTDPKTYVMSITLAAMVTGLSFNAFFPQVVSTLGYDSTKSLLLCAPPFIWASLVSFINARHSDAKQERFWHIVAPLCGGIVGFIIAMSTSNVAARYVAMFLAAMSYAGFVVFLSWLSGSFPQPPLKRAIAIALVNSVSQLGNIAGSYVWPSAWAPSYHKSFGIALAMYVATFAGLVLHRTMLKRENKQIEEAENRDEPTNLPHGFRYIL